MLQLDGRFMGLPANFGKFEVQEKYEFEQNKTKRKQTNLYEIFNRITVFCSFVELYF